MQDPEAEGHIGVNSVCESTMPGLMVEVYSGRSGGGVRYLMRWGLAVKEKRRAET